MNYTISTKQLIASHLAVMFSDILSVTEWMHVYYVHIRNVGYRFVSKEVATESLELPANGVVSFARFAYDCKHGTRQQHGYLNDNNCTFDRMEGMTMLATMPTGELIDISPSAVYVSLHFNSNKEYNAHYFGK